MNRLLLLFLIAACIGFVKGMSRSEVEKTMSVIKYQCMLTNSVEDDQIIKIEQGAFLEDRNVMCYVACIFENLQVVKKNQLSYEALIRLVDSMFPPKMKEPVKAAVTHCKDVRMKYKDLCKASYWTAKCMQEFDPDNYVFA